MSDNTFSKENRLDYIDAARGIGILLVICGHHLMNADIFVKWIMSFHMPLFFFIMGMLDKDTDIDELDYIRKKARQLMYPYLTFSCLAVIWYVFYYILLPFKTEESFLHLLLVSISTYGHGALWFLPAAFIAESLYFYLKKLKTLYPISIFVVMLFGTGLLWIYSSQKAELSNTVLGYCLRYVSRFCIPVGFIYLGSLIKKHVIGLPKRETTVLLVGGVLSVLLFRLNVQVNLSAGTIGDPVLYLLCAVSGSTFVIFVCKRSLLKNSRSLQYLGKNSLIVMATHMDAPIEIAWILFSLLRKFFHVVVISDTSASVIVIFIEIAFEFLIIYCVNRWARFLLRPEGIRSGKWRVAK